MRHYIRFGILESSLIWLLHDLPLTASHRLSLEPCTTSIAASSTGCSSRSVLRTVGAAGRTWTSSTTSSVSNKVQPKPAFSAIFDTLKCIASRKTKGTSRLSRLRCHLGTHGTGKILVPKLQRRKKDQKFPDVFSRKVLQWQATDPGWHWLHVLGGWPKTIRGEPEVWKEGKTLWNLSLAPIGVDSTKTNARVMCPFWPRMTSGKWWNWMKLMHFMLQD